MRNQRTKKDGGGELNGEARPVRYEAQPTRMFGAYQVIAVYADGSTRVVDHGEPHDCLRRAEALTAGLDSSS